MVKTDYKFLDISYFYKLFGSVVKGKEITASDFCKVVPQKKEFNITVPVFIDLSPTLNYWRHCKGIDVVYSPSKNVYICLGEWPIDVELFNIMYPNFSKKDIIYDKASKTIHPTNKLA